MAVGRSENSRVAPVLTAGEQASQRPGFRLIELRFKCRALCRNCPGTEASSGGPIQLLVGRSARLSALNTTWSAKAIGSFVVARSGRWIGRPSGGESGSRPVRVTGSDHGVEVVAWVA